jgi:hypothetical protein
VVARAATAGEHLCRSGCWWVIRPGERITPGDAETTGPQKRDA